MVKKLISLIICQIYINLLYLNSIKCNILYMNEHNTIGY